MEILYYKRSDGRVIRRCYRSLKEKFRIARAEILRQVNTDDDDELQQLHDQLTEQQSVARRVVIHGMHWAKRLTDNALKHGDVIQEALFNVPEGEVAKARTKELQIVNAAYSILNLQKELEAEYLLQLAQRKRESAAKEKLERELEKIERELKGK